MFLSMSTLSPWSMREAAIHTLESATAPEILWKLFHSQYICRWKGFYLHLFHKLTVLRIHKVHVQVEGAADSSVSYHGCEDLRAVHLNEMANCLKHLHQGQPACPATSTVWASGVSWRRCWRGSTATLTSTTGGTGSDTLGTASPAQWSFLRFMSAGCILPSKPCQPQYPQISSTYAPVLLICLDWGTRQWQAKLLWLLQEPLLHLLKVSGLWCNSWVFARTSSN